MAALSSERGYQKSQVEAFYGLALKLRSVTSAIVTGPPRCKGRKHRSHRSMGTESHYERSAWDDR